MALPSPEALQTRGSTVTRFLKALHLASWSPMARLAPACGSTRSRTASGNAVSVNGRGGAARNTLIQGNTISGRGTVGINVSGAVNTAVRGNRITGSSVFGISLALSAGGVGDGIVLGARSSNNTVEANNVSGSRSSGISVKENASNNTFRNNDLGPSGDFDAKDTTTGRGAAGTANTWTVNECSTSSPDGLCS